MRVTGRVHKDHHEDPNTAGYKLMGEDIDLALFE
jgi:hypothetical protein